MSKRKHYWQKWQDEEGVEHRRKVEKPKAENYKYRFNENDLCWFLSEEIVTDTGGLPFSVVKEFVNLVFGVIADVLIEEGIIELQKYGTIECRRSRDKDYKTIKFIPKPDFRKRLVETGEHYLPYEDLNESLRKAKYVRRFHGAGNKVANEEREGSGSQ